MGVSGRLMWMPVGFTLLLTAAFAADLPGAPAGPPGLEGPPAQALQIQTGMESSTGMPAPVAAMPTSAPGEYSYNPSGRRDPFSAIIKDGKEHDDKHDIPPLQRLSLTELNLIGIVWGGFGYSAMVQAPDGKGYTIRTGTRVGPNNGVVSSITENAIVVQERFTDVYGNKQVREHVKLLHAKEGIE